MIRNLLRRLLRRRPSKSIYQLIAESAMTETSFNFRPALCTRCPDWVIPHPIGYCLHAQVESFYHEPFTVSEHGSSIAGSDDGIR